MTDEIKKDDMAQPQDVMTQLLQSLQGINAKLDSLVSALGNGEEVEESAKADIKVPIGDKAKEDKEEDKKPDDDKEKKKEEPKDEKKPEEDDKEKKKEDLKKEVTEVLKSLGIEKVSTQRPAIVEDSQYVNPATIDISQDDVYAVAKGLKKFNIEEIRNKESELEDKKLKEIFS